MKKKFTPYRQKLLNQFFLFFECVLSGILLCKQIIFCTCQDRAISIYPASPNAIQAQVSPGDAVIEILLAPVIPAPSFFISIATICGHQRVIYIKRLAQYKLALKIHSTKTRQAEEEKKKKTLCSAKNFNKMNNISLNQFSGSFGVLISGRALRLFQG